MLQHFDVSLHQHSSITRSTHNFLQQLSLRARPHPKEEGAHVLSVQHLTATSYKGFPSQPPLTRVVHHYRKGLCTQQLHLVQLLQGMWLFVFCLLHTHQLHPALVSTPHDAPAAPPTAPLKHPEQCHTQRPHALEGKSHSPLNISVHQQPDQYTCHSHKDWVMVHTLQPYGSKRGR